MSKDIIDLSKSGYVVFTDAAAYEIVHKEARDALGLPRIGFRVGRLAPDKQQTIAVALTRDNVVDVLDFSVATYIDNRFWPNGLLDTFTFLTKEEVSDHFPDDPP